MEKIILDNSTGVDIVKLNEKFKSDKNEEFIKNTALYYNAKVCYGK